jgi:hypothetical protein
MDFASISQFLTIMASLVSAIAAAFASLNSMKNGQAIAANHQQVTARLDGIEQAQVSLHAKLEAH